MSTQLNCIVHHDTNVTQLSSLLKEHAIVYDPPYNLSSLLSPYIARQGRRLQIIVHHSSRNISIVDDDIRHHVLQTTIAAFQSHQLSMAPVNLLAASHRSRPTVSRPTASRPTVSRLSRPTASRLSRPTVSRPTASRPTVSRLSRLSRLSRPTASRLSRPTVSASVQDTGKQCSICFETITSDQLHCLPCAHVFHDSCVRRWFEESASCPVCRLQLA